MIGSQATACEATSSPSGSTARWISPIRDHLKAIFEKVGVSSRGELTSKLFAEHYHGPLNDAINTVDA